MLFICYLNTDRDQSKKSQEFNVCVRDHNSSEALRGCFNSTDWEVFFESCDNYDELADTVTSYMQFCENTVIKSRDVCIFPNNKPWLNKELKGVLTEKKIVFFLNKGKLKVKELNKEFRKKVLLAKLEYKYKMERNLFVGNAKDAWKGLNTMMGRNQQQKPLISTDPSALANDLKRFYARFDTQDLIYESLISCPVTVDEGDVVKCLSRINPRKAPRPDGLKGRVLKVFADQLVGVFTHMFQLFLNVHFIPHSWKMSTVTPVPKRPGAKEMNDFRPDALTSIIAKCMERIVCNQLIASVAYRMDPLQFACHTQLQQQHRYVTPNKP